MTHTVDTLMALAYKLRYAASAGYVRISAEALRTALTEALAQPVPPHECKTYEEKLAYAAGWWKALEANSTQTVRAPLTDDVIFEIACGAADEMWPDIGGVEWTKEDAKFYRIFCRKIERAHHIGGDK